MTRTATVSIESIQHWASALGLSFLGATPLDATGCGPLPDDRERLARWQQQEHHGEMSFMARAPDLLANPLLLMPEARSVLSFAAFYERGDAPAEIPKGFGRVARYAWGRDYHRVLKRTLEAFVAAASQALARQIQSRIFSDAVPMLERALARTAGGGFIGKNTMLIQPRGKGSFFFLCEVLWDLDVEEHEPQLEAPVGCGTCVRCLSLCPTQAFSAPFVLDARRCISYLTIEKRGALSEWEREALGEWVFGCDVCQEVCPFNHAALKEGRSASISDLAAESGVGHALDLREVLSLRTDQQFIARFGGTAIMRTKREGLLRNATVVVANTGAMELCADLERCVREDPSPVVRSHALWGFARLMTREGARTEAFERILDLANMDTDANVRMEAERWRRI